MVVGSAIGTSIAPAAGRATTRLPVPARSPNSRDVSVHRTANDAFKKPCSTILRSSWLTWTDVRVVEVEQPCGGQQGVYGVGHDIFPLKRSPARAAVRPLPAG